MRRSLRRLGFCLAFAASLSGCAVERVFYYPNNILYYDPHAAGLEYELVSFPSLNGATLYGLYFQTKEPPKGTIVHFHGNFGNVSHHFPLTVFLLKKGFDVLTIDYQGYGGSEGRPGRLNSVEDGIAAVRYAQSRRRAGGVGVFGQSLGAAVGAVVAAREPLVKAAALEAGFTTYRAIAAAAMRRNVFLWPFSWVLPPLLVRRRWDPYDHIKAISPRPVLIIHGTKDRVVPIKMARKLYKRAAEPKELWVVEGAPHLGYGRVPAGKDYEEKVAAFFTEALK